MRVTNTLGVFMFITALIVAEGSWGSGEKKTSYSYDLSDQSDLTKLYNSKVYEAVRVTRPLDWLGREIGDLRHSGVRVTLEDGTKWLVHKGGGYGISSDTVVVADRHMSDKWTSRETKNFEGTKTVSDLVEAGETKYKLLSDNCHSVSRRMMED